MSAESVALVRALQAAPDIDLAAMFRDERAFARAEGRLASYFDPDCEIAGGPDFVAPIDQTGLRGLRALWLEWLEPWASYRTQIDELIDIGGERVLVLVRDFGRVQAGGPEVGMESGAIWSVAGGKIVRVVFYTSRAAALRAAELA